MPDETPGERRKRRFQIDLAWNYASLAILGVGGITLNVVIGLYYDSETLGVFNQVFATYMFFSMLAAGGINFSVLRAIAENGNDPDHCASVLRGALVPAFALSALVAALFWFSADLIAAWLKSEPVAHGIRVATIGLFFFAINKVLLATVNGLRRMRAFAVYQSLRYLLLLIGLLLAVWMAVPGASLASVFSFAEVVLFVLLALEVSAQVRWWRATAWQAWAWTHLRFGIKSVLSGVLLGLNARIDILMLGYFLGDSQVGVYSFAALFAEGFFHLLVVLRNNYNPILAEYISLGRLGELQTIIWRGRTLTYLAVSVLGVVAIFVYPTMLEFLTNKPAFLASHTPFVLLVAGIMLAAGYLPFQNILSMANLPGWHSLFIAAVLSFNVVANAILIPAYGINGAAAATGLASIVCALLLRLMARRFVHVKI